MAWIRAMEPAKKKKVLYKDGTWAIPYDNNPRSWSGVTSQGWTLNASNMTSNSTSIIGSNNTVDVTDYSTLRAKILMSSNIQYSSLAISTSRDIANIIRETRFTADPNIVEYTVDVSDRTSVYVLLLGYQSGITCTEIWLE